MHPRLTGKGAIMAVFNKNTLTQISGFDNQIIAGELVYQQKTYWNLSFSQDGAPIDLTGATIDAQIIRRKLSDEVLERLLRLVSDGNLKPGDAMPSVSTILPATRRPPNSTPAEQTSEELSPPVPCTYTSSPVTSWPSVETDIAGVLAR